MDKKTLREIEAKEIEEAKRKSRLAYDMEIADSIIVDDINDNTNINDFVDLGSIIDIIDVDNDNY